MVASTVQATEGERMRRIPRTLLLVAVTSLVLAIGAGTAAAHGGFGGGGLKGAVKALAAQKALQADVAKRLGTTTAKLTAAVKTAAKARIDDAVEDDELTADEAAALKEAIDDGSLPAQRLGRASVVAKELGVTTAKLNEAYREARKAQALARVDQAVADGDLDADEAAELKDEIEDADFPGYAGGRGLGFGLGHRGGPGGPGGFGMHGRP
jgi:polyhydroxyalkanoate synthesis regulator phasin